MDDIIRIQHLSKRFGEVQAVDDLSFSVKKGELFAFLGVNGAGKSTTISILCGQLKGDGGSVRIGGEEVSRHADGVKRRLGVVFQSSALDSALNVRDNLKSRAALYGIAGREFENRLAELDALIGIKPLLKRPVGRLSGGQRRRADVARALIHRPDILILDEPTTGLDPQTRRAIWDAIAGLRRESGLTVLLTTHYMEEAADADHVLIIESGRIAAEGTPLELKNRYSGDFITLYGADESALKTLGRPYSISGGAARVEVPDTAAATALLMAHPELFTDYEITKGKMDDIFLAVTGRKLAGGDAQ